MEKEGETKIERELSYQEKYEMVRGLDLKGIENYEFSHPAEACPDLKEYFAEMYADPAKGLISFTEKFLYNNKGMIERKIKYEPGILIYPVPDLEVAKQHGCFTAQTIYPCYGVIDAEEFGKGLIKQYLHEALGLKPTLENVKEISKRITSRGTLSDQDTKELSKKLGYDVGIEFREYYEHIFPSSKEYDFFHKPEELIPKITFNYKGHKFEIFSEAFTGNQRDWDLPYRPDNKLGLTRESRMKLLIDGKEYREECGDSRYGKKPAGESGMFRSSDRFQSWRKWCELEDLVLGPAKHYDL
jgi:hypothetical protein